MSMTLNLDKLFSTENGYLFEIRVSDHDDKILRSSRDEIRQVLESGFGDWTSYVNQAEVFETEIARSHMGSKLPKPKFRMQGSFDYHTVNDCQRTPPQQIDMDDGVYLPVSFLTGSGSVRPGIAFKAYFRIVEGALRPLCARKGWKLKTDKSSCVRVELSDRLHIDLPLYAIQDEAFSKLVTALDGVHIAKALSQTESLGLRDDVFTALTASEIFLAHRDDGWIVSDPRKLGDWFANAIGLYGYQIRRLARIFKGLRDHTWENGGLSSIAIMAALVKARSQLGFVDPNRDDLAIVQVGRKMVEVFASDIENPVFPGDPDSYLCKDWSDEFRSEVRGVFAKACDEVESAITGTLLKSLAIARVQAVFGPRVPSDQELLALVGAGAIVRETPSQPQPRPLAPRTKSG